jgi:Tol biopolymer transport system component
MAQRIASRGTSSSAIRRATSSQNSPALAGTSAWSPDSTRVAVWVGFGETIGVYGVDGERQALLTMPRGWRPSGDHDPMWLPDGQSLLVQDVVVPVDGSTPHNLPFDDRRPAKGTYSPDGSRVAYADSGSLVVAEADGSKPHVGDKVRGIVSLVWSPTGDRIAFTSNWNQLRVLDVATGTVKLLADAGGSDTLEVIDFSPERDRIFFSRMKDGRIGVGSLWSVNADGSDLRRLVAVTAWGDWLSLGPTP